MNRVLYIKILGSCLAIGVITGMNYMQAGILIVPV